LGASVHTSPPGFLDEPGRPLAHRLARDGADRFVDPLLVRRRVHDDAGVRVRVHRADVRDGFLDVVERTATSTSPVFWA
jgi:hypothetical protein